MDNSGQISGSGQISAPGSLESGALIAPEAPRVPAGDLAKLAAKYGLKNAGARPSLGTYLAAMELGDQPIEVMVVELKKDK